MLDKGAQILWNTVVGVAFLAVVTLAVISNRTNGR
tara:strand:+ start:599 stop:703 length:105 start_codon:yes stop_codon:yes gene_type:complete